MTPGHAARMERITPWEGRVTALPDGRINTTAVIRPVDLVIVGTSLLMAKNTESCAAKWRRLL
ncbi:hypothetical protein C7H85_16780 [Zobellella endophytica]|uniref:Uncharacterized protein n=1 Tax=Zobellella endophytica TaxID=2116700 RepID=A0A2P7QXE2_9GAMM|nr:hypothetical protein C7H85_16780 [Zobellella endophytica]